MKRGSRTISSCSMSFHLIFEPLLDATIYIVVGLMHLYVEIQVHSSAHMMNRRIIILIQAHVIHCIQFFIPMLHDLKVGHPRFKLNKQSIMMSDSRSVYEGFMRNTQVSSFKFILLYLFFELKWRLIPVTTSY